MTQPNPLPSRYSSNSEYKKKLKAAQVAKAKAEKDAAKKEAAAAAPKPAGAVKSEEDEEGELDPTQYTANRIAKVLQRKAGPYTPHLLTCGALTPQRYLT